MSFNDVKSTPTQAERRAKLQQVESRLVLVKFLVAQPPYCVGETAGFPPDVAERILTTKIKTANGYEHVAIRVTAPVTLGGAPRAADPSLDPAARR